MWQDVATGGPPRFGGASAAVGHFVFTFGGYVPRRGDQLRALRDPLPPMEVFVFDTRTGESEALPTLPEGSEQFREVPRRRYGHSAVAFQDAIFVWGGDTQAEASSGCLEAVWRLREEAEGRGGRWERVALRSREALAGNVLCACAHGRSLFLLLQHQHERCFRVRWWRVRLPLAEAEAGLEVAAAEAEAGEWLPLGPRRAPSVAAVGDALLFLGGQRRRPHAQEASGGAACGAAEHYGSVSALLLLPPLRALCVAALARCAPQLSSRLPPPLRALVEHAARARSPTAAHRNEEDTPPP